MMTTYPPEAETFLAELETAAGSLTPGDRFELLADIRSHLEEALPSGATDAQVQAAVSSLGSPADIVAAAGGHDLSHTSSAPPPQMPPIVFEPPIPRLDTQATIGLVFTAIGWLVVPIIGPILGWILIATSNRWTAKQKAIGIVLTLSLALAPVFALIAAALPIQTSSSVRSESVALPVHPAYDDDTVISEGSSNSPAATAEQPSTSQTVETSSRLGTGWPLLALPILHIVDVVYLSKKAQAPKMRNEPMLA